MGVFSIFFRADVADQGRKTIVSSTARFTSWVKGGKGVAPHRPSGGMAHKRPFVMSRDIVDNQVTRTIRSSAVDSRNWRASLTVQTRSAR